MVKHRHSRDFRFIRTSERKKKPETIIDSTDVSAAAAAAATHPAPTVACGVLIYSVRRTHFLMAAGAFLFGYRVQPIGCPLFQFVVAEETAYLPRVLSFSVYRTLPGRVRV